MILPWGEGERVVRARGKVRRAGPDIVGREVELGDLLAVEADSVGAVAGRVRLDVVPFLFRHIERNFESVELVPGESRLVLQRPATTEDECVAGNKGRVVVDERALGVIAGEDD